MTDFNPDWYADSHQTGRNLAWYLARARRGDAAAAARALELVRASLTPQAIRQSGGRLDPVTEQFLLDAAALALEPKKTRGGQRKPAEGIQRDWWLCVELHRRCRALGRAGDQLMAQELIDDTNHGLAADSLDRVAYGDEQLLKLYRRWRDAPGDPLGAFLESPDSIP